MNTTITLAAALALAAPVCAQSLYMQSAQEQMVNENGEADPAAPLYGVSLYAVVPQPPRQFAIHDLITIVIDETSKQSSDQKLETDKEYKTDGEINAFPSLRHLAELQFETPDDGRTLSLDANYKREFSGDGKYSRQDKFQATIKAEVIDVKPNGTMLIEARAEVSSNGELQRIVLSGLIDSMDITESRSVRSSQIANKKIVSENEGQVNKSGSKGWITKTLDTFFAF